VALQPGAQIGSYEVTALIGAGGMGEVYRATDTNLGRQVAIKVCAAAPPLGASWSADNTILFGQSEGIMRVSADGGTPEVVVKAGENEALYGPQLMPDGRSVLFTVTTDNGPARWTRRRSSCSRCRPGREPLWSPA
jgi:hypothetical protein